MKSVKYLLGHLKPYKIKMTLAVISGILKEVSVIVAVGICAYMAAIAGIGKESLSRSYLEILLLTVLARAVFSYLESYLSHDVAYHILVDFRVKLYNSFIHLCPDILFRQRSGQISTTLMNDVEVLEWFYAHTAGYVLVDSVVVLIMTVFLWTRHWSLGILLLAGVGIILIIPFLMKDKADKQGKESRFRLGEANSVTLEGINGMNELLMLNAVDRYQKKNKKFMDKLVEIQVKYAQRMGTEGGLLQIASGITAVIINICAVWLVLHNQLSLNWFAVIGTTVWLAFAPVLELCSMARNFGVIFAASGRISAVLSGEPLVQDTGKISDISETGQNVTFKNVCYRYVNTTEDVLKNVSFTASEGKVTALVGESGAGKTTCTNLLTRMWDVKSGEISIGGIDIRNLSLDTLHHLVTVVPQDVYLFNTSIRENISLGRPDATEEEIQSAAKMAMVHSFIMSLPEGYDTVTGERGVQLSGGQKQRIAIARALLMDAPILVMDEAVSNLDTKTDMEIQKTLRNITDKKTIILVAHRLSTIMEADELVVFKNGQVVQKGTHQELCQQEGYYKELIKSQINES